MRITATVVRRGRTWLDGKSLMGSQEIRRGNDMSRLEVVMDFFDVLSMAGGPAVFLYGMPVLGAGLSKDGGGRLGRILEKVT